MRCKVSPITPLYSTELVVICSGLLLSNTWRCVFLSLEIDGTGRLSRPRLSGICRRELSLELADHKPYGANLESNLAVTISRSTDAKKRMRIWTARGACLPVLKTKQVDETRARVLMKEKRYSEAEKVARSSVRTLERTDICSCR